MPRVGKNVANKSQNKKTPERMICQNPNCDSKGKEQLSNNFYDTNSELLPKYPVCKKCVQGLIDLNNIQTIYKILQEMNKPFLQDVWNNVSEKSPDNPFGSYIRQINSLPQHKNKFWKDSIFNKESDDYMDFSGENSIKTYSSEWTGQYTKPELAYLNNYYKGLHDDFKILTTNHKDYARKIAQASLAVNKAFQEMSEGVPGADKKYKDLQSTFDTLSKSAQFSENSRSNISAGINSISQVVDKIESKTWIYEPDEYPKDAIEHLLDQFNNIHKSL